MPKVADATEHFSARRRTMALAAVAAALVVDVLDTTIVNVAMPSIGQDLHVGPSVMQWIVAAYALGFSTLLITGGRLGDVVGYRRMFCIGISLFAAASLACGMASGAVGIVVARLCQGSAAAMMVPQVGALVQVMYLPKERFHAMGLFGALGGAAGILGPVLGGILIRANLFDLGWRTIFLINLPVGIVGLTAGILLLPEGRSSHPTKLDLSGTLLLVPALTMILLPIIEGSDLGWPAWCFGCFGGAVVLLLLFWRHCVRRMTIDQSALMVPSLFQLLDFRIGCGVSGCFQTGFAGFLFALTLTLQTRLGFTPFAAGMTMAPFAAMIGVSIALFSRRLVPRFGARVITLGAVVMILGLGLTIAILHWLAPRNGWVLIPSQMITGAGMGLMIGPLSSTILGQVEVKFAGAASGLLGALQQFFSATGVALVGTIFFLFGTVAAGMVSIGLLVVGGVLSLYLRGLHGSRAHPEVEIIHA